MEIFEIEILPCQPSSPRRNPDGMSRNTMALSRIPSAARSRYGSDGRHDVGIGNCQVISGRVARLIYGSILAADFTELGEHSFLERWLRLFCAPCLPLVGRLLAR